MRTFLGLALFAFFVSSQTVWAYSRKGASTVDVFDVSKPTVSNRHVLPQGRKLLAHEGVIRTLIIRVTDGEGVQPASDARQETDMWFGTHNHNLSGMANDMAGLYDQCSGGKILFVPATHEDVIDGVLEMTVPENMTGMGHNEGGEFIRAKFNELNQVLGIQHETFSIILPEGVRGNGGIAGKEGNYQFYAGTADQSLDAVMHEIGHNIGFLHSGVLDEGNYRDNSCLMGCCAGNNVQMCFNAAKSWYSGWYTEPEKDGHVDVNHFDTPGQKWSGDLVGVDEYLTGNFDQDKHGLILRTKGGLYAMFNRGKGVNAGVRRYKDEVVIVQQWGEGGQSYVFASLNAGQRHYRYSPSFEEFDINFELCELFIAPVVTGPLIEIRGTASQSSTCWGNVASRAIDMNLDQTWGGGSITYAGCEEDLDPWWALQLDEETEVEHVRIYNRVGHDFGQRLTNAILELYNSNDEIIYTHSLGPAEDVRDVYLGSVYLVKKVQIQHVGVRILSLAEVQLFAPLMESGDMMESRTQLPDYARVLTYLSSRDDETQISCETLLLPTLGPTTTPTPAPSVSLMPIVEPQSLIGDLAVASQDSTCHGGSASRAIDGNTDGTWQGGSIAHTCRSSNPWLKVDLGRDENRITSVVVYNRNDCCQDRLGNTDLEILDVAGTVVASQPFEGVLDEYHFDFGNAVGRSVRLNRKQSGELNVAEVEVFGVFIDPATESPSISPHATSTSSPTAKPTPGPTANPVPPPPDPIPTPIPTTEPTPGPTANPVPPPPDPIPTPIPTTEPTLGPITNPVPPPPDPTPTPIQGIPDDVTLRIAAPCYLQVNLSNHPDRFKCALEQTTSNGDPGDYSNTPIMLSGAGGCLIEVRPVTWAWDGYDFIFQSQESLDSVNSCFTPGTLLTYDGPGLSSINQDAL